MPGMPSGIPKLSQFTRMLRQPASQLTSALPMAIPDPLEFVQRIQESIEAGEPPSQDILPELPGGLELPTIPALPEGFPELPGAGNEIFPEIPTIPLPPLNQSSLPTRQLAGLPTIPGLNHATMPIRQPIFTKVQGVYRESIPYTNRIF